MEPVWSWRRCIQTIPKAPLQGDGFLAILIGDVACCWQETDDYTWDSTKFSYALALHGCGWVPSSRFSTETVPLEEMPSPLCNRIMEFSDHCFEYPERWIQDNMKLTKTRIAEVRDMGIIEPSWDDAGMDFRLSSPQTITDQAGTICTRLCRILLWAWCTPMSLNR